MADGKPFSTWLSGDLLRQATERAGVVAQGNESKYVRALIERDVATKPETLLLELAKQFHPALAERINFILTERILKSEDPPDGRVVLARFLDAYAQAMKDPEFQPEQPFSLVDTGQLKEWDKVSEQRMIELAHRVAEIQSKYPAPASPPAPAEEPKPAVAPQAPVWAAEDMPYIGKEISAKGSKKKFHSRAHKTLRQNVKTSGQIKLISPPTSKPA